MLKSTTRLFFAGAMAATLIAVNTGAFAAESKKGEGHSHGTVPACCMQPQAAKTSKSGKATAVKTASAKTAATEKCGEAECCKKPAAAVKTTAKAPAKVAAKAKVKS